MGIYIGGTGSANLLDDFEEGTFTPRIGPDNNNSVYESGNGSYTKIGKQVHLLMHWLNKNPNSFGSSTNVRLWNFPFNIRHGDNGNSYHALVVPLMFHLIADAQEQGIKAKIFNDVPEDEITADTVLDILEDNNPEELARIDSLPDEVEEEEMMDEEIDMGSFLDMEEMQQ